MAHLNGIPHSEMIRASMESLDSIGWGVLVGGLETVDGTVESIK